MSKHTHTCTLHTYKRPHNARACCCVSICELLCIFVSTNDFCIFGVDREEEDEVAGQPSICVCVCVFAQAEDKAAAEAQR